MATLRPSLVQVTDTAYKPAVLIGGNAALSDDSDATYAEQWLSLRASVGDGPSVIATFDPATEVVPLEDAFRFRYEVFNEAGAAGTDFAVFVNSGGLEVGTFQRDGSFVVSAPATGTIYDWTGWTYVPTSGTSLADVFAAGFDIRTRRLAPSGATDGDWGIRVYEISALAEGGAIYPRPVRLYPRDDGRGFAASPRIYPPSKARRIVGGYQ